MKLGLKRLAVLGLSVVVHHEAEAIQKTLHPRDPEGAPGIWSASHELILEHVEPVFPVIPPSPPEPPNQNGDHYGALAARWKARESARFRAASAVYYRTA